MYNLLITYDHGQWEKKNYEIETSRFLEYTIPSISKNLKSLSQVNIEFLLSLPCLFAYEGETEPYRVGRLTKIRNRDSRIYIEYELDNNVESIPFERIKELVSPLDIRPMEINRTHWAVKDGDLFDILQSINIKVDDNYEIEKKLPPQEKEKVETVSTVTGFVKKVFNLSLDEKCEIFYRGHSNKEKYKLEPSLFRKDEFGNYLYLQNEDILYKELLVSNSIDFLDDDLTLDKLVRMQHYSLPTRMLDITSNPLISLYFACNSSIESEGEVIVFYVDKNFIKYFDSDTASCIANLARLPQHVKDEINFKDEEEDFNEQKSVKRLLHFIGEEKPYFKPKINPKDLKKIICVKSKMTNNRILSQSGAFLLFGHESIMNENGMEGIRIERITVRNKKMILDELDRLNINERTVFPYIENSAKYISKKYKVKY